MKVLRAYQFRMYPNNKQKQLIQKSFGTYRFIYNYFLNEKQTKYKEKGMSKTAYEQIKTLSFMYSDYPFLKEVDSCLLRCSILNLEAAYKRFYKGSGYPKYKKKGIHDTYRTNNIRNIYKGKEYNSIKLDLENRVITLSKLKEVKIRGYRFKKRIKGRIINATVRKEANKYYVSVLVEEEKDIVKQKPRSIIGIDLGIKDTIITSEGYKVSFPDIKKKLKRVKGLQKGLSRCEIGSKNRYKLKIKIQRLYLKIKNIRKYFIHNVTNKIVKGNDIIAVEDLNIKCMYQNKCMAKSLINIPLSEIIEKLKYKTEWLGKKLIQVDRYYASSQECNRCGYRNKKVKDLNIRNWICPNCNNNHNRDINASINIMYEGLKKYMKRELQVI